MAIKYSLHAREQMIVRGISVSEVAEALMAGSKYVQKPDKIVAQYKYFVVIYKVVAGDVFIITVMPRW